MSKRCKKVEVINREKRESKNALPFLVASLKQHVQFGLYSQLSLCIFLECFFLHLFPTRKASTGSDVCVPFSIWNVDKVFYGINLKATLYQQIIKRREVRKPCHKLRGKEFTKWNLALQSV